MPLACPCPPKLQVEETIVFSLEMIHAALLSLGRHIMHYDLLVSQVHIELLHAMCQAAVRRGPRGGCCTPCARQR